MLDVALSTLASPPPQDNPIDADALARAAAATASATAWRPRGPPGPPATRFGPRTRRPCACAGSEGRARRIAIARTSSTSRWHVARARQALDGGAMPAAPVGDVMRPLTYGPDAHASPQQQMRVGRAAPRNDGRLPPGKRTSGRPRLVGLRLRNGRRSPRTPRASRRPNRLSSAAGCSRAAARRPASWPARRREVVANADRQPRHQHRRHLPTLRDLKRCRSLKTPPSPTGTLADEQKIESAGQKSSG
jgi:hypothetical protein